MIRTQLAALMLGATILASSASPARAQITSVGRLLVSAGVRGAFGEPVCGEITMRPPPFAGYAAAIEAERDRFGQRMLVLDTGGMLAPHGVGRFAAEQAPEALATLIRDLGYHALAFGEAELAAPRADILSALRSLREAGVPVVASNLRCEDPADPLCRVLVDASDGVSSFTLGERRVAFLSFLAPEALERIAPQNASGLRIAPISASMATAVRAARARGAQLVIVSVDDGSGGSALASVISHVGQIPTEDKPDLVLSAGAGSETIFARPSSFRPAVVGPRPGGVADVHIRYNGTTRTLDMLARPMGVSEGPSAAIDAFIAAIGPSYCERWGRQLAGGRLVDGPMDASDLLALGAGILRDQADAEIALVNTGVVDSSFSRGAGEVLTASDVFLSLLYDEPLMRASVSAQWLTTLARSMDPSRLLALGLEISGPNTSGEKIKVNGRPIEARGSYTVTTLRFLAAGGDGLLPEGVRWEPTGLTLRGAVLDHLGQAREIDPRASLSNPADRLEWTLREDLSATFTGTVIRNAAGYGATQLTNSETTNFGIESTLGWAGVSRLFAWENTVLARFGLTSTAGSDFEEGTDLLSYRTTARWRGLRDARAEIYVPDPFLEGYVESELTRPDERDYHHLLLRPTLGLQFTITRHLSFRGSAGFELNALDPEAELLPGLGAVLELKSWRVMSEGQSRLETAFLLDYFVAGVGDLNRQTLRGRLEASINLTTVLSLSLLVDVFGMRERDAPFAFGTSTTAALKLSWLGRRLGG